MGCPPGCLATLGRRVYALTKRTMDWDSTDTPGIGPLRWIHREAPMHKRTLWLSMTAGLTVILQAMSYPVAAQTPAALAGQVSSADEGLMEGVLVSAKR